MYPLQSFATTLATMIGIGVGIDYALFVVTRYRQGLQSGLDPEEAVITAIDTSGRAVLFAGLTVIIALLGMLAIGLSFISGLGIGAAAVVAVTVAAAVTLLPAVLGFTGTNIDKWRLPWVHDDGDGTRETMWHRWSRFVQRHAWALTIGGLAIVLTLAMPVLSLRLGFTDAGNDPSGTQTRQAYDLLSQGFGPGFNGPFLLAIELPVRRRPRRRSRQAASGHRRHARGRVGFARAHEPGRDDRGDARVPDDRTARRGNDLAAASSPARRDPAGNRWDRCPRSTSADSPRSPTTSRTCSVSGSRCSSAS